MPGHKDWLKKAHGDLKAATILACYDEILDIAAFHTHQCAEKSLKSFLMNKRQHIPKTHNLEDLVAVCFKIESTFLDLLHDAISLDPYATNTRYPDDHFSITKDDVKNAIVQTERIFKFIERLIV